MWKLENSIQLISFLVCCGFGAGYCLFYDVFRSLRKAREFSVSEIAVQDIIYFLAISLVTFLLFLKYTYGEIRAYIFIAILFGFLLFRLVLSRFVVRILERVFKIIFRCGNSVFAFFVGIKSRIFAFLKKYACILKKYCKIRAENFKNYLQREH